MKNIVLILCMVISLACQEQSKKPVAQTLRSPQDTTTNPKTEVHVNKKYDEKGNLIRFDSTYSYHYVSPGGASLNMEPDTLFRHFKSYYLSNYDTLFNNRFGSIFFNDSLFKYDFMQPDYFSKRFELNQKRFQQMMYDMDSIKQHYLKQDYPQGEMKKK